MAKAILKGRWPKTKTIAQMAPGEEAYTAPWAYDEVTGTVRTDYTVVPHIFGSCKLLVRCVMPGVYEVELQDEMR